MPTVTRDLRTSQTPVGEQFSTLHIHLQLAVALTLCILLPWHVSLDVNNFGLLRPYFCQVLCESINTHDLI